MAVKINGKSISTHVNSGQFDDHLTPAKHQVVKSGTGSTSAIKSYKGKVTTEGHEDHVVANGLMIEASKLASVTCMGGRTINLGNYESVKFEASVTLPCSVDQIDMTYDFAMDWVGERISAAEKMVKS